MMFPELEYQLAGASWSLVLTPDVTRLLLGQAQGRSDSHEAMGQLYARDLTSKRIFVCSATHLRAKRASHSRVTVDVREMAAERKKKFREGLHFVGLWHTHPELEPTPSFVDRLLAQSHAQAAADVLRGIAFVIVGDSGTPASVRVWVQESAHPSIDGQARLLKLDVVPPHSAHTPV